jgi:hypothetical protein
MGRYCWVPVHVYQMPKPSVAESLTWAWLWRYHRGRRCGEGRMGTAGYGWVQVHFNLIPIPLLQNL